MPFEARPATPRKVAVIGAGISGMGAAHFLSDTARVTLFEAGPKLGGHARTIVAGRRGDQPVDTGFIVFNYANYPTLKKLFARLDVPVVKSNMSFAASLRDGKIEYGLANMASLFAQRSNLMRPRFIGMVRDIMRFNARALSVATDRTQPLRDFLAQLQTGDWFRDYYLLPLSGAIWSTPTDRILDFPAHALVQFFENHALLSHTGQHQWWTVKGGSVEYVRRLENSLRRRGVSLRPSTFIAGVRRTPLGVEVRAEGGEWEKFDDVIFATHSDDTLRLLSDASPDEQAALGAIRYQPNSVTLHADASIMPRRRACWSSWNYAEGASRDFDRIDLTYWMNSLQDIPQDDPMFVTLNSTRPIREELIYDQTTLRHPVFDLAALKAQDEVRRLNGTRNTWFTGAWMRHGFHEDGLKSALDVAQAIRARDAVDQVA